MHVFEVINLNAVSFCHNILSLLSSCECNLLIYSNYCL